MNTKTDIALIPPVHTGLEEIFSCTNGGLPKLQPV